MDLSLSSRFKNAWNAFRNRAPTMMSQNIGSGYSYRPDRFRLTRGNERSIVTSVYNRIALDVAAINIQHVQLDDRLHCNDVQCRALRRRITMEHSKNYSKVKLWYRMKMWNETKVRNAVKMGWITKEEFAEITGKDYE